MLVVFFLSSLKKIVEQMHQTMCKRKISKVNVQILQVAGMLLLNILQLYLLISSSLFVYDLPEPHPRPLLSFWVAAFLPSIPQLLFCCLMLSQLLHQMYYLWILLNLVRLWSVAIFGIRFGHLYINYICYTYKDSIPNICIKILITN